MSDTRRQLQRGRRVDRGRTAGPPCSGAAESASPVAADRRRHSSPGGGSSAGKAAAAAAAAAASYYPVLHPMARYHPAPCQHPEVHHCESPMPVAVGGSSSAQPGSPGGMAAACTTCAAAVTWRKQAGSSASLDMASLGMQLVGDCPVTGACRSSACRHFNSELAMQQRTQRQAPAAGTVDVDGCLHVDVLDAPEAPPGAGSSIAAAAAAAAVVHGGGEDFVAAAAAVQPPRQGAVLVEIA